MDIDDSAERLRRLHEDVTFALQQRQRPDRHSYQVGILAGLLVVAISQIVLGLPPQSALYEVVNDTTLIALNMPFIVGSVLTLAGAALNRDRHFVLSVRLGIFGHLSTFVASVFYSLTVIVATQDPGSKPYWLAVTSVGLAGGLAYASWKRWREMRALLRGYRRRGNRQ